MLLLTSAAVMFSVSSLLVFNGLALPLPVNCLLLVEGMKGAGPPLMASWLGGPASSVSLRLRSPLSSIEAGLSIELLWDRFNRGEAS